MAGRSILTWVKVAALAFIYLFLSGFMLFVAIRTYQFSGGFVDSGTIAVVVGLTALVLLMLRVGFQSVRNVLKTSETG